jgi:hypothetical protein
MNRAKTRQPRLVLSHRAAPRPLDAHCARRQSIHFFGCSSHRCGARIPRRGRRTAYPAERKSCCESAPMGIQYRWLSSSEPTSRSHAVPRGYLQRLGSIFRSAPALSGCFRRVWRRRAVSFPTARSAETGWPKCASEADAARAYEAYLREAFAQPYILGYHGCHYMDRFSKSSGVLMQGLVGEDSTPSSTLVEGWVAPTMRSLEPFQHSDRRSDDLPYL